MDKYTTAERNGLATLSSPVGRAESLTGRVCEHCGMPLRPGMRAHARYCCPSCRAAAFDERHERGSHRKGGENG